MLPFGMSWRLSGSLSKPVMCSVNWFACAQMDVRMAQMESRPLQWRHEQFRLTVDHSGGVCFSNTSQNYSQEFIQSDDAFQKSFFFFLLRVILESFALTTKSYTWKASSPWFLTLSSSVITLYLIEIWPKNHIQL